jgi:hypothetical protein
VYKSMHEFAIDIRKLKAAASVALSATSNTITYIVLGLGEKNWRGGRN